MTVIRQQLKLLRNCTAIIAILLIASCGAGHTPSSPAKSGDEGKPPPATQRPYRVKGQYYRPLKSAKGFTQTGIASWYGRPFHGRKTANGERYDMYKVSAAHKTLPMDTWVRVHNLDNGKKLDLRINDRGPFVRGRIIDLSYKAAQMLGVDKRGTARVRIKALGRPSGTSGSGTSHHVVYTPVDYYRGNFTVQVGAFSIRANAEKHRTEMSRQHGHAAHITTFHDGTTLFYRVRVGQFNDLNDAERFRNQMMNRGVKDAFVVAE